MQDDDLMLLQDPQFFMVLVAAITKKYGGSITISVNDMEHITNDDALGLFKDVNQEDTFILKLVNRADYKDELARSSKTEAKNSKPRYALYDDEEWEN